MARNKEPGKQDRERSTPPLFDGFIKALPGLATQTFAKAAEQSGNLLDKLLRAPDYMEYTGKAGRYLKDLRQVAGLTLDDLARAVEIENLDVLQTIEEGRSPITLDILFRLASFYSRNDPFSFMLDFSKEYAPWLWQILRFTGVEKLLITVERELKFINIYRSRDRARTLSPVDFERVVTFTDGAFAMALEFVAPVTKPDNPEPQGSAPSANAKNPPRKRSTATGRTTTRGKRTKSGAPASRTSLPKTASAKARGPAAGKPKTSQKAKPQS